MPDHHMIGRTVASICILSGFLLFIFVSGISDKLSLLKDYLPTLSKPPDFSRYIHSNTLSLPPQHKSHRIIIVGDVHAQIDYLQELLANLHYKPSSSDVLIHVGDIVAKGPIQDSLRVLDWMSSNNVTGVRGNHDQNVIDWRNWQDWVKSSSVGAQWLEKLERRWKEDSQRSKKPLDPHKWVKRQKHNSGKRNHPWWKKIPEDWRMFSEHYLIAL